MGTREKFEQNSRTWGPGPVSYLEDQHSIATAYNKLLDSFYELDVDVVVLVHDDLEVLDREAEKKVLLALADPEVALVGVAGGCSYNGLAWWTAEPVGHQYVDTGLIDFGIREGDVDSLEGSFMAFGPWAVEHLRFDEEFVGFHGYDHIGERARRMGKVVRVVDLNTHHHTQLGFKSPESEAAWHTADALFRSKFDL